MSNLSRAVYAIARTKRRRWLWCAWWTGEPTASPFRSPDAWGGGAKTEDEARILAERAAGVTLERVDGRWAGAWMRIRAGSPPFPTRTRQPDLANGDDRTRPTDPYALLGIVSAASIDEVKAAFRKMALEHHPDRGGSADAFIRVKRAYDAITARRRSKRVARSKARGA